MKVNRVRALTIGVLMMAVAGTMTAAAAETTSPKHGDVFSSYEFSSVSYGTGQDGNTYSRVVTTRNGVTESDITTVNGVVTNAVPGKEAAAPQDLMKTVEDLTLRLAQVETKNQQLKEEVETLKQNQRMLAERLLGNKEVKAGSGEHD